MNPISKMVNMLAIGSTMPDNVPITNALLFFIPSECSGMDNMAPSGKFCIAIPIANAHAADVAMLLFASIEEPKITPTAIPSGILCSVTASESIVVRFHCFLVLNPSGVVAPACKCGITVSSSSRNNMPNTNPAAAGIHVMLLFSALISRLGMSNDHIDAATMTPDANPKSSFRNQSLIAPRSRNTMAAPKVVPMNGNNRMGNVVFIVIF